MPRYTRKNGRFRGRRGIIPRRNRGYTRRGGYYNGSRNRNITEVKFADTQSTVTVSSTGTILRDRIIIAQGDGESERNGRKAVITNLSYIFMLHLDTLTNLANAHDQCRIIIALDRQCNGTQAAFLDYLTIADMTAFRNLSNRQRFFTIYDKVYSLSAKAATITAADAIVTGTVERTIRLNFKVNIPMEWSGTTDVLTNIRSNNVFVWAICEHGGVISVAMRSRARFIG